MKKNYHDLTYIFYKLVSLAPQPMPSGAPPVVSPDDQRLGEVLSARITAFHSSSEPVIDAATLIPLLKAFHTATLLNRNGYVSPAHFEAMTALGNTLILHFNGNSPFEECEDKPNHNLALAYLNALLFYNPDPAVGTSQFDQFKTVVLAGKDALSMGTPFTEDAKLGVFWQMLFMGPHFERGSKRVEFETPQQGWDFLDQLSRVSIVGWSTHGKGLGVDGSGLGFRYDAPVGRDNEGPYALGSLLCIPSFSSASDRDRVTARLTSLTLEQPVIDSGHSAPCTPTSAGEQHAKELALGCISLTTLTREFERAGMTGPDALSVWNVVYAQAPTKRPIASSGSAVALFGFSADVSLPDTLTDIQKQQARQILGKFINPSRDQRLFHARLELARDMNVSVHILAKEEQFGMQRSDHAKIHNSLYGQMTKPSPELKISPELKSALVFATESKRVRAAERKEHLSALKFTGKASKFIKRLEEELSLNPTQAKALFRELVRIGALQKTSRFSDTYQSNPQFLSHSPEHSAALSKALEGVSPHSKTDTLQGFLSLAAFYPRLINQVRTDPNLQQEGYTVGSKRRLKIHGARIWKWELSEPVIKKNGRIVAASDVLSSMKVHAEGIFGFTVITQLENFTPQTPSDAHLFELLHGLIALGIHDVVFEGLEPMIKLGGETSTA